MNATVCTMYFSYRLLCLIYHRVKNNLDPEWCTPIYYEYPDTGEHIFIKVAIYDDNRGKGSDELMGEVKFDLKEAIDHPERTLNEELETGGM